MEKFKHFTLLVIICVLGNVDCRAVESIDEATSSIHFNTGHNCKHTYPTLDDIPHPVKLEDASGRDKREADLGGHEHQLRIEIVYHESVEKLDSSKRAVVKEKVVVEAVNFWESALKIRQFKGPIRINRKCKNNMYFLSDEPDDPYQYCKESCVPTTCGEFMIPEEHLEACRICDADGLDCKVEKEAGPGVPEADFVLYVSAINSEQCGNLIGDVAGTVAYAAHCQQEADFDRPIAGHTNICPSAINDKPKEIAALISTIKHELLHALGFSSSLFAFFRDSDGKPRTPRNEDGKPPINTQLQIRQWSDSTIMEVTRPYKVRSGTIDRKFHMMVTPKVVEEVRNHFGCPDLEGAELEDQGGDGTALTHWEKRIFHNEAMTGTVHTQNPTYSRLTLALLEDSGWYLPNYDMADEITWGRGMGCDFARLSCLELMTKSEDPFPFCKSLGSLTTTCTHDRTSIGNCNLVKYSEDLPEEYQNFDKMEGVDDKDLAKLGGSVVLADHCPYIQEFSWKSDKRDSLSRGSQCQDVSNSPEDDANFALETYGDGALCFQQSAPWHQRTCTMKKEFNRYGGGCYHYKCDGEMLHVVVVGNFSYTCAEAGQTIDISRKLGDWLHAGTVVCPACVDVCGEDKCKSGNLDEAVEYNKKLNEEIDECSANNNIFKDFLNNFNFKL